MSIRVVAHDLACEGKLKLTPPQVSNLPHKS